MDRLLAAHRRSLTFYPPPHCSGESGVGECSALRFYTKLACHWEQGMFLSPNEPALRFIFRVVSTNFCLDKKLLSLPHTYGCYITYGSYVTYGSYITSNVM